MLRPGLVILWALLATATRNVLPAFFWFTMIAMPLFVIYKTERQYFKSPSAKLILKICVGLFVVHAGWAFFRSTWYDPIDGPTYWWDDLNYYDQAVAIAEAWKAGFYPDIKLQGAPPYLGTLHTGYHRPLAALFLIAGPSVFAGLILNAMCAALLPLMAALSARYLWQDEISILEDRPSDVGLAAALLTALHPGQFYWSSFLLKDVYTSFAFMAAMTLILGSLRRRSASMAVASIFLLPYIFSIRAYTAISLVLGTICVALLKLSRKQVLIYSIAGSALVFILCSYTTSGYHLWRQLRDSFMALAPAGFNDPGTIIKQIGGGIPPLLLAPYAWIFYTDSSSLYWLYPAMWFLYLVIYPLAFAGLYSSIGRNVHLSALPLAACGLASLLFLTAVYAGIAPRQRYYLEYAFILYAAYGFYRPSKSIIISILILELAFMVGQYLNLR